MRIAKRGRNEPGAPSPGSGDNRGRTFSVVLLALFACGLPLFATSSPSSSLEGVVTLWSSTETVAGVVVTVTGEDRPVARETTADLSGRFRFPLLPPGRYSVTATGTGYSSVTLVGIVVVPGEERRVSIEVTRTDEDESVTETIDAELQAQGIDGGWVVPALEAEALPLLRGTVGEVAMLFPGGWTEAWPQEVGESLPVETAGAASMVVAAAGAAAERSPAGRPLVTPRWGSDPMQGNVRLVRGERDDDDGEWLRGVLTLGGSGDGGARSGFLSIDHVEDESGVASGSRTAITATAALATTAERSWFLVADGAALDGPVGNAQFDRTRWSARASHEWQISRRGANTFEFLVEDEADDVVRSETGAPSLRLREQSLVVNERVAWMPGSRLRQELRAGLSGRIAIDDRLTVVDPVSGTATLRGDREDVGVWLEGEWMPDRLFLRGGLRVDRLERFGESATEVSPRVAFAWHGHGEDPLVLRGSWGQFHEAPDLLEVLLRDGAVAVPTDDFDSSSLRPTRTDRAVVGLARDLSGLAAWSLDVVSSRTTHIPFVRDGVVVHGEVERLEATLGGRVDVFGMADAILAWTWSDTESDVPREERPEHRGSLALHAALPANWAAAAIVRYDSGLEGPEARATDGATTLDLSLSASFALGEATGRVAVDAFNVTGEEREAGVDGLGSQPFVTGDPVVSSGRSIALNVSYRFGY